MHDGHAARDARGVPVVLDVLPALLRNQLENKKVKLAQMGRSVFNQIGRAHV